MTDGPAGRDELSRTLREWRDAAGLSTRAVADRTGFSHTKVSRIERGVNVPTEDDVAELARVYQPPAAVARRLAEMARDVRAENRRIVLLRQRGNPAEFQRRVNRIEAASAHVRTFTSTVVPGLLQTEAYIRGLIAPDSLPPEELEDFVVSRLSRQKLLDDPARRFTLITAAGALARRPCERLEMAAQVEHIAAAVDRWDNVQVGIVPWGARVRRFPLHGWNLYDERAVIVGTVNATVILNEPSDVRLYVELFAGLADAAVYGDEARAELATIAKRYRSEVAED
ncbi:MAG: helix-turn-helix domain-containing protein [Pseudonocardia sp.]